VGKSSSADAAAGYSGDQEQFRLFIFEQLRKWDVDGPLDIPASAIPGLGPSYHGWLCRVEPGYLASFFDGGAAWFYYGGKMNRSCQL